MLSLDHQLVSSRPKCISTLQTQFALPTPVEPDTLPAHCWQLPPPMSDRPAVREYLPTPPDTPLEPLPVPLSMFSLPIETLDRIFSFVPFSTLPIIMRANSRCHQVAERLLYFKIQHIQLFSAEDGHCTMDWRCLSTLASRSSAAAAVRHFAIKGLPWLDQNQLLASALSGMVNLLSLDLNLGPQAELGLLSTRPVLSASLCAINVLDWRTALDVCKDPTRPISSLRIHFDSPLDRAATNELLSALRQSSGPVQELQIALLCNSKSEYLLILRTIVKQLPNLRTLGVHIRPSSPLENEKDWELARSSGPILASLSGLQRFSLAGPLYVSRCPNDELAALCHDCQRLEAVELQWSAWSCDPCSRDRDWKLIPPALHAFMRRRWVYEHACRN